MNVVVFDTEHEAIERESMDFLDYTEAHGGNAESERWAIPRRRVDGRWDYECCPFSDYSDCTVESYNLKNYIRRDNV